MLVDVFKPDRRKIVGGIPYLYDGSRTKWLSEQENQLLFRTVQRNILGTRWIDFVKEPSNESGAIVIKDCTVKGIHIFLGTAVSCTFKVFKNVTTEILSVTLASQSVKVDDALDIDLQDRDELSCQVITSEKIDNVNIFLTYSFLTT